MFKGDSTPPSILEKLLHKLLNNQIRYSAIGDYSELYSYYLKDKGELYAYIWYSLQIARALLSYLVNNLIWSFIMFKNYLKITVRNMIKSLIYCLLNIIGLALGFISAILIILYINEEFTYDTHHYNHNRIFRITSKFIFGDQEDRYAVSPHQFGPLLKSEFPEIEEYVRFMNIREAFIRYEEKEFYENAIYLADSTVFSVFTHKFLLGSSEFALDSPNSIVLTESTVKKYFGNEYPLQKVVNVSGVDCIVTGVIKDVKHNSHLRFDGLVSMGSFRSILGENTYWRAQSLWIVSQFTYLLIHEGSHINAVLNKFQSFKEIHMDSPTGFEIEALPLRDIHLKSDVPYDLPVGNIAYVHTFLAVALFLLLIAIINYINISTARSARRSKEVGVRKVCGAFRKQLIRQFLTESVILTICALSVSLGMVKLILPYFNELAGKELNFGFCSTPQIIGITVVLSLMTGILAGSYPAFHLSSYNPVKVMKGISGPERGRSALRKILVTLQFVISIVMIIGSIIAFRQLSFLQNRALGFSKENTIIIPTRTLKISGTLSSLKTELVRNPNILGVATASRVLGDGLTRNMFNLELNNEFEQISVKWFTIDWDFLEVMNIPVIVGRNFRAENVSDLRSSFIVNETAIRQFNWQDNPIGRRQLSYTDSTGTNHYREVIGVTKDFHYGSLHNLIEPNIIIFDDDILDFLYIKINASNTSQTIEAIRKTLRDYGVINPIDYFFLDESLNQYYTFEQKLKTVFNLFAGLCIFITCLGMIGLTSFMVEKRTKEVGIRKILGASGSDIVILLLKELIMCILIGIILAIPIAYYTFDRWLRDFPYRTDMSWIIFIAAGIISLIIAIITVSYQSIKAAMANPVDSLRYE